MKTKKEISTLQAVGYIAGTILGTAALYLEMLLICAFIA